MTDLPAPLTPADADLRAFQFTPMFGLFDSCTPRPATEKAVFRPALACASHAGAFPEKHVTTYSERLKDPRWQRRRLEILQRSDFSCECCGAKDKTLHVHHKLYRKGAMPWEYADHELQALCETCHETEHQIRERISESLARINPMYLDEVLGFIDGLTAREAVANRELVDGRIWPLHSAEHAEGFYIGLRSKYLRAKLYELLDLMPIDDGLIGWLVTEGLPSDFAEKCRQQEQGN